MKQFTFTSQLAPIIWKYLESRQNEGYTSVHCGYYMQELDCLSKELSDAPVVTKELIDAWDLLKPYLSNRSKIVRHNAIRAFAKFAYTQDGISYVPDTSKLKNSSTFTPHIFTVEEIRRLLYAADNLPVRNNAPTRHLVIPAVIRLLYCCGFRIGEVLRLRVKDVDLDTGIITVHNGKGGKDRLVPVHNSVIEYLRSYSAQLPDEREWFFPSACGHYSIKTIYDNFRELLFACNIPHTGNGPRVHDFRHTFAVHTLEKQLSDGYDPMVIVPRLAAYLGHKSYRETCWYMPVLFRLLYTCGLRVSEALHLKVADVDLDAGVLAIYGAKGDKERLVGISDSMLAYMKSYRSNPLVTNAKSIYFFPAPDGGFYDTSTIYDIFRKCLFDAGIPHRGRGKGPRLHDLRHSFAIHILNKWSSEGKDIYTCLPILRTALGHDRITTTEKYLRLVPEAYMEVTEPFNDRFHTITEVLCNEE